MKNSKIFILLVPFMISASLQAMETAPAAAASSAEKSGRHGRRFEHKARKHHAPREGQEAKSKYTCKGGVCTRKREGEKAGERKHHSRFAGRRAPVSK